MAPSLSFKRRFGFTRTSGGYSSMYLLVFIQNLLMDLAEKILLWSALLSEAITMATRPCRETAGDHLNQNLHPAQGHDRDMAGWLACRSPRQSG